MFLELVATFVAGLAAAGLTMVIVRSSRGRLPRWLIPVAGGAGMLAATISSEYGWFERTKGTLPPEFAVVSSVESKAFYRPWTYPFPFVDRFVAVDTASVSRNPAVPDQRLADVFFYKRWSPINKLSVLTDCIGLRRAPMTEGVTLNDDGTVTGAQWRTVGSDDSLVAKICEVN